jgi:hypothetical protein
MTTDWVLVIVSSLHDANVDSFPVVEPKLVARKDPVGEKVALQGAFLLDMIRQWSHLQSLKNLALSKVE